MRVRIDRHLQGLMKVQPGTAGLSALAKSVTAAASGGPVLPPEFTWRDYTVFLLTIAAQIEHSLMVQYLYAAYSLGGPQLGPPVTDEQRNSVAAWRQIILGIAKEEMGHLVTVQNVLRFLGAPLSLDREDYPWDSQLAPYPFVLEPLSRASLAKYIIAESPETWPPDVSDAERVTIENLASGYGGSHVNRVGALYSNLIGIISNPKLIPSSAFRPESFPSQASWDEWGRGYGKGARGSSIAGTTSTPDVLVLPMASRSDAVNALNRVAEQGEAPGEASASDTESSHFRRFLTVFRAFPADGKWKPVRSMPTNPVVADQAGAGQKSITEPDGILWANIFNIRYRMLLTYLAHTFGAPRGTASSHAANRRGVIINRVFGEMYNLRAIASILTHLPIAHGSKMNCGPTFQMPYTLQLPEDEPAYWNLHLDLIAATSTLLAKAGQLGSSDRADYAAALGSLDRAAAEEMKLYAAADSVRSGGLYNGGVVG
jgi:hypothetical protein